MPRMNDASIVTRDFLTGKGPLTVSAQFLNAYRGIEGHTAGHLNETFNVRPLVTLSMSSAPIQRLGDLGAL